MNAVGEVRAAALPTTLKFEIGARTLMSVKRRLVRVALTLDEARGDEVPALPPIDREADGYIVTSLPVALRAEIVRASGGMLVLERQRYTRYYTDFGIGFDAWMGGLSSSTRQGLKRKAKRIAAESGGTLDVRRFGTPDELARFHPVARQVSAKTYQEKLLGSGLPEDEGFVRAMLALSADGRARGWLLYLAGEPVAYLYCPVIDGGVVIYAHVGHDPAFNDLSPGAVLQLEAMRDLFADGRFNRFDFTEGEGQHKRQLATGGVECVDLLLLRPTLANRATLLGLGAFNGAVALAKQAVQGGALEKLAKRVRRGG